MLNIKDDFYEELDSDLELENPVGSKVNCSVAECDFAVAGITITGLPHLTIVGANSEYTVIPTTEDLIKFRDGIDKMLHLLED